MSASTSRSGSSVVPSASSSALAVTSPSETADASMLFLVIFVLGFVVGMGRRSSPHGFGTLRTWQNASESGRLLCKQRSRSVYSLPTPRRNRAEAGQEIGKGQAERDKWKRMGMRRVWPCSQPESGLRYAKTLPPVDGRVLMLYAVTRQPLTWCGWSGQPRGTRGRGRRRSSGRPCAAAPERHSSGR